MVCALFDGWAKFATSVKRGAVEGRERHRVNAVRVEGVGSAVSFSAYPQQRMGRSARGPRIDRKSVGNKSAENPFDLIDSQIPDMGVIVMSQQLQVSLVVVPIFTWTKMQYVREDFQEVLFLGSLNCHKSRLSL